MPGRRSCASRSTMKSAPATCACWWTKAPVPLVADIHFDHRLAIEAVENGIAKVRINPGNIGGEKNVRALADCLRAHRVPVRIGVNAGSLERDILQRYGGVTAEGMVESGLNHARMLERAGWDEIVLSFKASSVRLTVDACRLAARRTNYPQHIWRHRGRHLQKLHRQSAMGTLLLDGRVLHHRRPRARGQASTARHQGLCVVSCPPAGRHRLKRWRAGCARPQSTSANPCAWR